MFKVGDYVTRKKYNNDIIFKIDKIEDNKIFLKGIDVRLYADSTDDDLILTKIPKKKEIEKTRNLNTEDYFYIPGKILHLDSDEDYLKDCLQYYKENKVIAFGYLFNERDYKDNIVKLIKKHNPNIIVLTGHDAYYKNKKENKNYMNSEFYIETVKEIRKEYISHNELIIFAGACQSNYDGLLKSGATYASSPKHINIHSLDPAIISTYIALTDSNETVEVKNLLQKTKYGSDAIGGIITKGMMYTGYPRKE